MYLLYNEEINTTTTTMSVRVHWRFTHFYGAAIHHKTLLILLELSYLLVRWAWSVFQYQAITIDLHISIVK